MAVANFMLRFREDLEITHRPNGVGLVYSVTDPQTGETFEFGEEDYFLCRSLDGRKAPETVALEFQTRFGGEIALEDVVAFSAEVERLGLASPFNVSIKEESTADRDEDTEEDDEETPKGETRWRLGDPDRIFRALASTFHFVRVIAWPLAFLIIGSALVALWIFFTRQEELTATQTVAGLRAMPYIGKLILTLFTLNALRCLVQGITITDAGGAIHDAGIRLRFGFLPRFYINRRDLREQLREQRMWCYASTLLNRLAVFVGGTLLWLTMKESNPLLAGLGVLFMHAGLIGFLLVSLPVRTSDGYRLLVTAFHLPENLIKQSLTIAVMAAQRKPLPVSRGRAMAMIGYVVGIVTLWVAFGFKIVGAIGGGLSDTFPDLFGRATPVILVALVAGAVVVWAVGKMKKAKRPELPSEKAAPDPEAVKRRWIFAVIAVVILLLPFPYRPGGTVILLPPAQQPLEALESGIIDQVLQTGGDGKVLEAGTIVAQMRSPEIQHANAQSRELLRHQQAQLARDAANLRALESGARKEELDAARARADKLKADVAAHQEALNSAQVSYKHAQSAYLAYVPLAAKGAYATLLLDDKLRDRDVAAINADQVEKAVAAAREAEGEARAQLALLEAGAREEELEAARQTVAATQAEVNRLTDSVAYTEGQLERLAIKMPIRGVLVESRLDHKINSRLTTGNQFATAQESGLPLVEVSLPESEAEEVKVGAAAEVRLFARPNSSLKGEVLSIEPVTANSELLRVVQVLVRIRDEGQFPFKAGMTGFAKIKVGYRPLGYLLLRPIIRFFQVEVWSWLP